MGGVRALIHPRDDIADDFGRQVVFAVEVDGVDRPVVFAQGRFTFKDASRRDINIPVSFKGFSAALEALGKQ